MIRSRHGGGVVLGRSSLMFGGFRHATCDGWKSH